MLSYWEKQSFTKYDFVIVGAGITGLSAAVALKEKNRDIRVLVLEKGLLPTGASTKNAGFACVGSLTEILDDLEVMSREDAVSLVKMRKEGLELLRKRLGDEAIGYQENGSYELLQAKEMNALSRLDEINELLHPLYGKNVFEERAELINEFDFSPKVKTIIASRVEGEINTGMMMCALYEKAISLGIEVKTGAALTNFEDNGVMVNLVVNGTLSLQASKLIVCTNAFTKRLLPEVVLSPGRGQVLITEPIANLKFKGIFHFDKGYYYYRVIDGRVLFGGGRNIDFERETTTDFALNQKIQADLGEKLRTIILPNTPFKIAHRWTGIMAFGDTKKPIVKTVSPNVKIGVRLGGMGIAIGSKVGELLADF